MTGRLPAGLGRVISPDCLAAAEPSPAAAPAANVDFRNPRRPIFFTVCVPFVLEI